MRRLLILICFYLLLLPTMKLSGQNSVSYKMIDTTTYGAYLKQDWESVIKTGRLGVKNGVDYYYLRMRMGIAYYMKGNYSAAIPQFKKAQSYNKDGEALYEYLFHAYEFLGRKADAKYLVGNMTQSDRNKNKLKYNNEIYGSLSFQYLFNANPVSASNYPTVPDPIPEGSQIVLNNMSQAMGDLMFEAGTRLNLYLGLTYVHQTRFYNSLEEGQNIILNNQKLSQYQIYTGANIFLGNGWNGFLSYHYLYGITPTYYYSVSPGGPGSTQVAIESYRYNDHVFHISALKDLSYFKLGISVNYSKLQDLNQAQGGVVVNIYPLGNLNLYSLNSAYSLIEFNEGKSNTQRLIYETKLGWKVFSGLWMEFFGSWGDHTRFSVGSGRTVYNGPNRITQQYGGSLIIPFSGYSARFFINYYFVGSESEFYSSSQPGSTINGISITSHAINGGLSWTF